MVKNIIPKLGIYFFSDSHRYEMYCYFNLVFFFSFAFCDISFSLVSSVSGGTSY